MRSHKYEMYIANTLQNMNLLRKKEQNNELNIMINNFRSNDIWRVYNHKHYKIMKKLYHLAGKVPN